VCGFDGQAKVLAASSQFDYKKCTILAFDRLYIPFTRSFPMLRTWCLGTVLLLTSSFAFGQDLPLSGVLVDGKNWELVSDGHKFTEGPAVDAKGQVYFTDIPQNKIHKIDLEGKVSVFLENSQGTNGLMFGPDGKLYGCQSGARKIVAFDDKGQVETIADEVDSNDLVVGRNGGIFFTDPKGGRVWYINPKREKRVVAEGLKPNGVILTPDEGSLVVTDGQDPTLWTFRVEADGGFDRTVVCDDTSGSADV
jgi:gluconolactonase